MAKCNLVIEFDRKSRSYEGGENVSGVVHVSPTKEISCRRIVLNHYWKTHGRGNTDQGTKDEFELAAQRDLLVGETYSFPFEFACSTWPLTYHGNYISLDHYVEAVVDMAWAIDPKHEEDFIVTPGLIPEEFTGDRGKLTVFGEEKSVDAKGCGKIVGGLILTVIIGIVAATAIFLVPLILIGLGIWWARNQAIRNRLGEVKTEIGNIIVAPGENWPIRLSFTPKKRFRINGISLKLTGTEAATSGSGTDATTYTHTLFEDIVELHAEGELQAGQPFDKRIEFPLPQLNAWNLSKSSNKITWNAQLRIDIPMFPDWSQNTELQFVPSEYLAVTSGSLPHETQSRDETAYEAQDAAKSARWETTSPKYTEERPQPLSADAPADSQSSPVSSGLVSLLQQITASERFGNERSQIIEATSEEEFDLVIEIDRIVTTFGLTDNEPGYEDGRTITGKLAGTEFEIQIFTLATSNDVVGDLSRHDVWQTHARVTSWDSLYNRLVLKELSTV